MDRTLAESDRTLRSRGSATAGVSSSERMLNNKVPDAMMVLFIITGNTFSTNRTLAANRPNAGLQRLI